ncbi:glycosyltransferase family 2 protein [Clostridium sp. OS1-26]|uniref:glycosyltransferase family 2 protein n=1 Tax=Clostridium sp. OS1-26 TaxID=3070681 RepID=UPI0027DFDAAF|nr:glycosyltransferase family 2 protein [Clostridium sp. OS1-26]WML35470.1 glycosyltransferase family 2 protein [Clostridium sp. OS1-26]
MTDIKLPLVSIITPTLNSEKYIENTLKSIFSQTYKNIEHIIVDALSADKTLEIVKNYNKSIIICEPDEGIIDAFNKGVKYSTGEIIYFLNSDDYLYDQNIIQKVVDKFLDNPKKSILYGNVLCIDEKYGIKYIQGKKIGLEDLAKGYMTPHQGVFVRKSLFDKYGFFDIKYPIVADYDFTVKCFKGEEQNTIYYDETIAVFRLQGECSDVRNLEKFDKYKKQVMKKHFGVDNYSSGLEYQALYRVWLESLLLMDKNATSVLTKRNIKSVAIWGTLKTARYMYKDLRNEKIQVLAFIDNNKSTHEQIIYDDVRVKSPFWLQDNQDKLDAIIISIESDLHDLEVKNQIKEIMKEKKIEVFTWKEIINML